jgi:F-type H+-transporting ATPase subunit delta
MASSPDDRMERDAQLAAAMEREVGVEHIAGVYAEALLDATEEAGQTAAVLDQLDSLVADVFDGYPPLERILASGMVSSEEKSRILDRVLGAQALPVLLRFLKVVSRRGRLGLVRAIHRQAHTLYREKLGQVAVEVTTAAPFGEAAADRLRRALRRLVDGEPVLERRVQPELIGGMVVRVGDTIYDASVARQLETMRQQMIDRSAHEIQSRRDRFRYPAGN